MFYAGLTRLIPALLLIKKSMQHSFPISAYVICLNEEPYIGSCIESLAGFAEIVIVDSGSTDGTASLVQSFIDRGWPIKFMYEPWRGYAGQKQFALEQCTQPWCFNIDADERLDDDLRSVLPDLIDAPLSVVGWRVARRPYLIGYGYTPANVRERKNLRLIRNSMGSYDLSQKVHEGIVAKGQVQNSKRGSLLHYRPLIMDEQILKENRYSTLKADQKIEEGARPKLYKIWFSPLVYFGRLYFHNGLWRCGTPGFIEAATGGVYSFLTEVKIYQRFTLLRRQNFDNSNSRGV